MLLHWHWRVCVTLLSTAFTTKVFYCLPLNSFGEEHRNDQRPSMRVCVSVRASVPHTFVNMRPHFFLILFRLGTHTPSGTARMFLVMGDVPPPQPSAKTACTRFWLQRGVVVSRWSVGFSIDRSRVRVSAGHYGVKTLGKFLTPMLVLDGWPLYG